MFNFFCSGLYRPRVSFEHLHLRTRVMGRERGKVFSTHLPWTRLVNSAAIRGSISTAVHSLHFSRIRTVKLPVPGPISRTESVDLRFALSTILRAERTERLVDVHHEGER